MPHLSWIVSLSPLIDRSTTKRTVKIKPTKKVELSEIAPVVSCSVCEIAAVMGCSVMYKSYKVAQLSVLKSFCLDVKLKSRLELANKTEDSKERS